MPVGKGKVGYMPEGKIPDGKAGEEVGKVASVEEEAATVVGAAVLEEIGADGAIEDTEAVLDAGAGEEDVTFEPLN